MSRLEMSQVLTPLFAVAIAVTCPSAPHPTMAALAVCT
jgi:hypothetical protein